MFMPKCSSLEGFLKYVGSNSQLWLVFSFPYVCKTRSSCFVHLSCRVSMKFLSCTITEHQKCCFASFSDWSELAIQISHHFLEECLVILSLPEFPQLDHCFHEETFARLSFSSLKTQWPLWYFLWKYLFLSISSTIDYLSNPLNLIRFLLSSYCACRQFITYFMEISLQKLLCFILSPVWDCHIVNSWLATGDLKFNWTLTAVS